MGIEEIQKVNALARELMRHNIVQTSDEALIRAQEMLRGNSVNSMADAITSNTSIGKSEPAYANHQVVSELNMDIRSLGVRFEAVVREVLALKDEIKKLGGGLGDVSKQINRMSVQQDLFSEKGLSKTDQKTDQHFAAEPIQQMQPQQTFAREAVAMQQTLEKPKVSSSSTARAGREEFKPEDVAIEKIFYFGKNS
ncbi:hypothetical protein HYV83_05590 [Candidatus Woesearchaeota archaeon]|nr:hypothetical protein [Candidatus Woesearchaeota archaeon]